ncbi:hypothetical protein RRG08_041979 [Elysia crispata]|uniref:Uncharacterized protein n=1 Tax=Elysia crispata TaxID=231223 RepID=A0AAE0Z1J5_9GAST|nr:hypothetical protein RRG08_041979 [Elysia crispata]
MVTCSIGCSNFQVTNKDFTPNSKIREDIVLSQSRFRLLIQAEVLLTSGQRLGYPRPSPQIDMSSLSDVALERSQECRYG